MFSQPNKAKRGDRIARRKAEIVVVIGDTLNKEVRSYAHFLIKCLISYFQFNNHGFD